MKKYYLLIFIVFIAIMYNTVNRNRIISGYCSKEEKNLFELYSKQQLVDKAILYFLSEKQSYSVIYFGGEKDRQEFIVKPYLNIKEFKSINSDCCTIELNDTKNISAREKIYGYVEIKYLRRYVDNSELEERKTYIRFNSCGDMADGTRGFTIGVL